MKTVIEMAIEAELIYNEEGWCGWVEDTDLRPFIERFAELVRVGERKSMMQLFTDPENQPTQYGTVTVEYMQREIEVERESSVEGQKLKEAVKELFNTYLNRVEESDSGYPFHPVSVGCCRAMLLKPLGELLEIMRELSGADKDTLKGYYDR